MRKLSDRLGPKMTSLELNPPERNNLENQLSTHQDHLENLFHSVSGVGGINLPEIQEEEKKGDRGDRKSSFKERLSPREYATTLRETFDRNFLINRVIVQSTPEEQEKWFLETFHEYDIDSVVIVGGESSDKEYPGPSVTGGNRLVKNYLNEGQTKHTQQDIDSTDYVIGNICISTRRRSDFDEPERMVKKLKSGCDFFTSQIIAEKKSPSSLLEDLGHILREENLNPPPILWSITPINSEKDVNFLRWLGVKIPDTIERKILDSDDPLQSSLDHFKELWKSLLEFEEQLDVDIPMGLNLSPVAIRNFRPTIKLAEELIPLQSRIKT